MKLDATMGTTRTTIRVDPLLLAEAKKVAASSDQTLSSVIENALREYIVRRRCQTSVSFTIVDGRGLRPGVDLDNTSSLLDVLDA